MNLREFFKKLRSPLGTSLLFLAAIVTLTFSAVPFLIREDAGTLQVVRSESGEASFNIPGKAKAISAAASAERQAGSGSETVDLRRTRPNRQAAASFRLPHRVRGTESGGHVPNFFLRPQSEHAGSGTENHDHRRRIRRRAKQRVRFGPLCALWPAAGL